MTWIEVVAVVFGLICVWLTVRQNIWCWPTGLVQVVLYIVIFYQVKLYSDMILHVIYVALQIYGWHHWLRGGKDRKALPVSMLGLQSQLTWPAIAIFSTIGWGYLMDNFTDADIPYGDAFITVASLIAQWLMARKRLESWLFWIVVDVVAIGIFWHKNLHMTSGLYLVFLILSAMGWFEWKRSLRDASGERA